MMMRLRLKPKLWIAEHSGVRRGGAVAEDEGGDEQEPQAGVVRDPVGELPDGPSGPGRRQRAEQVAEATHGGEYVPEGGDGD